MNTKQAHPSTDIDFLPPNKRRLRERTAIFLPALTTEPSTNSDSSSIETTSVNREIPINSIKQFLEIRQQVRIESSSLLKHFLRL